jgi:N utilization substance protein A
MASVAPVSANKAELLAIADAVAREKLIDRAIVIEAMEDAVQRGARARYGAENDIRAKIDTNSGEVRLWRVVEVVEQVDDHFKQVSLEDAEKLQPGATIGDFIVDPLPRSSSAASPPRPPSRSSSRRCAMPSASGQYEEFKDRVGEIITGVVKRVEFGHVVVDLGRAEGVIRRDQQIPREVVRVGDRVRSLILKVAREIAGRRSSSARASRFHAQAVRAGSAGNLRRHHRDQGRRPRSGQPRQDRRDQP